MDALVSLVRRWAVEWLSAANREICSEILAPQYRIHIGGHVLDGRDAYVEGTLQQLGRFPGLGITIHELIASPEHVAVVFSEHGAAPQQGGNAAAWGGVALFSSDGEQLLECWAEEDYLSRRRQLASGPCDPVGSPAPAPWNTEPAPPDTASQDVVLRWLNEGRFSCVELDDGWMGHAVEPHVHVTDVELDSIFSAGAAVAFHGLVRGRYLGGLDTPDRVNREDVHVHLAGVVHVDRGQVARGRVIRDRLGLQRALLADA